MNSSMWSVQSSMSPSLLWEGSNRISTPSARANSMTLTMEACYLIRKTIKSSAPKEVWKIKTPSTRGSSSKCLLVHLPLYF